MDDQDERKRIIKEARSMVERLDATKHEWGREPSDEEIVKRLELRQRSEGALVYKTCERAAEPSRSRGSWIEQRLSQEREHIIHVAWRSHRRELAAAKARNQA